MDCLALSPLGKNKPSAMGVSEALQVAIDESQQKALNDLFIRFSKEKQKA